MNAKISPCIIQLYTTMFTCEDCDKTFRFKSKYDTHKKRKTPCGKAKQTIMAVVVGDTHPEYIPKPPLKWVGGKTQLLDKLIAGFPVEMNNYHEIFLGGGSVLLAVLQYAQQGIIQIRGKVYAYDINQPLIHFYKNIQTHPQELYDETQRLLTEWNSSGESKETYYYSIRTQYNSLSDKTTVQCSAMFLFLNKMCFRGMYRVGPNGFNVPYGNYKNPEILNRDHITEIHRLIQNVEFECCDFSASLQRVIPGDYMYVDPPYAPVNSSSFVGYTESGFDMNQHKALFGLLQEPNKKFTMSNADVELVREHFRGAKYNIETVSCRRAINARNPESRVNEVIIRNH